MITEAQLQLGVVLPAEYIALLRIQNGGYTVGLGFPMTQPTSWATDHVPVRDIWGIVTDSEIDSPLNILASPYMTTEWGLPPHQALLTGDGHWWITLDYRRGSVPTVTWLDVDCGEDIQVATTFAGFLEALRPSSEFDSD
jgi:hypothetical protein